MNTIETRLTTLQPQVSAPARIAAAIAVAGVLALAWLGAEPASHQAVRTASEALARGATHVTLPAVEVVGRRESAGVKSI